jgi:hypothetical protein
MMNLKDKMIQLKVENFQLLIGSSYLLNSS